MARATPGCFPWASSSGSDFNYDFQAAHTKQQWESGAVEYNFRRADFRPPAGQDSSGLDEFASSVVGTDWETYRREGPGVSAFALEDGVVYHTGAEGVARQRRAEADRSVFRRHVSSSGRRGGPMSSETVVRPFRVDFPDEEVAELRRRVNATRWPERETVTDDSQGVRLAMMQEPARYWGSDYDWRRCEAKLNDLPNCAPSAGTHKAPARAPGRDIQLHEGHCHDSTLARARRAARGLGPAAR